MSILSEESSNSTIVIDNVKQLHGCVRAAMCGQHGPADHSPRRLSTTEGFNPVLSSARQELMSEVAITLQRYAT